MRVGRNAVVELLVGDREAQPVTEALQLVGAELLDLVRGVAALDLGAQRPALDRLHQDRGRAPVMLDGHLVGRVHLAIVVAAAGEPLQILVGQVVDHPAQPRVRAEEVVADVGAALDGVLLELAVDRGVHLVHQHAVDVTGEELVPPATPDHLDDVPARTAVGRLQLLDDLAVPADRPVEALQVAVDDEDQVVELLARREGQPGERLGLVHLAVTDERPDLRLARVDDLVVQQVTVEARLVHRVERAETHGHRREFPEVRHAARMRIRRKPAAEHLAPEPVELLFGEASLEEGARIDPGGGVALEVHLVPEPAVALAAEEMVEAHVVERSRRCERGEVAAEPLEPMVGPVHHRHRVPPDV